MSREQRNRVSLIGAILVLIGVALLLRQMHILEISAKKLLWIALALYGAATVTRSFLYDVRQKIFWGSLCFFTGILFTLKEYGFVYGSAPMFLPAVLVIFGFSFLTLFLFNVRDWHLLIPSLLFLGLGGALMLTELRMLYAEQVWRVVRDYWPVALILMGGAMLLRRRTAA
ncbi:MAG: LiaF transmembrane domain-containing protein [Acidobacteriota bacterium]